MKKIKTNKALLPDNFPLRFKIAAEQGVRAVKRNETMTHQMMIEKLNGKNALYCEIKEKFETIKSTLLDAKNQPNLESYQLALRGDGNLDFNFFGKALIIQFINSFESGYVTYSKANEKHQPGEEIISFKMDRLGNFSEPYNTLHAGEYIYAHYQIMATLADKFTETP